MVTNSIIDKTKWSDLFNIKVQTVPQDIRTFMAEKCERYNENGFGYKNKNYSDLPHCTQIDTNAVSDEATFLDLINNNKTFVEAINTVINACAATGEIYVDPKTKLPLIIEGIYDFNKYHGLTDHDLPQHMQYEDGKTVVDLLRCKKSGWNPRAAWSIEIKTDNQLNKPTSVHKADIVLLHILGTNKIAIYLPTVARAERTDDTYILAAIGAGGKWKNIRIQEDWSITQW